MNKYLKRGIILTIVGIGLGIFGMYLKELEMDVYGALLIVSVLLFGVGFCTIIYALMRKIDRTSLLEARAKEQEGEEKTI